MRGFGYVLMDDTTAVHVVVGSPDIAEITGVIGVTAAVANKIADHVRRRTQANAEASADGDALTVESHYGAIQMQQESAIAGTVITVKKTDGTTTLGTKTAVLDANALPIAGVN